MSDIMTRALKTAWQGALAALLVAMPEIINLIPQGWEALKPVLLSAAVGTLAAGFSAAYNGVLKPLLISKGLIIEKKKTEAEIDLKGAAESEDYTSDFAE